MAAKCFSESDCGDCFIYDPIFASARCIPVRNGGCCVGAVHSMVVRSENSSKIFVNHSRRVGATGVKTAVAACARLCFQQGGSSECQSCSKLSECGGLFQSLNACTAPAFTRCDRSLQTGEGPDILFSCPRRGNDPGRRRRASGAGILKRGTIFSAMGRVCAVLVLLACSKSPALSGGRSSCSGCPRTSKGKIARSSSAKRKFQKISSLPVDRAYSQRVSRLCRRSRRSVEAGWPGCSRQYAMADLSGRQG